MMSGGSPFNSLLVPVDFSEASRNAFAWALRSVDGDASLIVVLHVIDEDLIDAFVDHGFGAREEVVERMRQRAFDQLAEFKTQATDDIVVDVIVVEGRPFLQILQKAEDFAVDAIVMGKVGWQGRFEKVLFGSTVDKVMRGAARPVMVLPG